MKSTRKRLYISNHIECGPVECSSKFPSGVELNVPHTTVFVVVIVVSIVPRRPTSNQGLLFSCRPYSLHKLPTTDVAFILRSTLHAVSGDFGVFMFR